MIVSHRILLRMINVSDKLVEKMKHILCSFIFFFRKWGRLWNNVEKCSAVGQVTGNNIIWRMDIASWIVKAKDTHSEYTQVIALLRQQCLCESASILRLYVHCLSVCLVIYCNTFTMTHHEVYPTDFYQHRIQQAHRYTIQCKTVTVTTAIHHLEKTS